MMKRSINELNFVRSKVSIPTVEVDIDTLPKQYHGCADILQKSLATIVENQSNLVATIYIMISPSCSFGKQTYSAFMGVAGTDSMLRYVYEAFSKLDGVSVRYSDDIQSSEGRREVHIESGKVWLVMDAGTWYANDDSDTVLIEQMLDNDEGENPEDVLTLDRSETPTRFRAARANASVGTIRAKIEKIFGLPEGSVALCGRDKRPLRSDATISTLRERWSE